ncbi:MAG: TorF family putative porin [Pseudomonadota bacterium]
MRTLLSASAALATVGLPAALHAEELEIYTGFAVVSEYLSDGFELSDGVAVQPYIEAAYGGFYAGIWATNADGSDVTFYADTEVDYYLGYRGEWGSFYYDVSVAYYTFQRPNEFSGLEDYEEYILSAGYAITDQLYATLTYGNAPDIDQDDLTLDIEYYTNVPGLTLAAQIADYSIDDVGDWMTYSIGASYAIDDAVTLDLTYTDSDSDGVDLGATDGIFVASISFDFQIR